ncbi:MAG: outer membrane beta-barrel protein [Planctomycetaceae bacterium]
MMKPLTASTTVFLTVSLVSLNAFGQSQRDGSDVTPWNVNYASVDDNRSSPGILDSPFGPLELGGWLSAGATVNAGGNRSRNGNAPLSFNNVSDVPVMNQMWVYLEKPLDMQRNTIDWGARIDYVFGADGPDVQASGDQGWDHNWNSSRDYGSAIPQLYGELGICDATFRAGYAFGLLGFEAAQAIDNFFYSHNYAFSYGLPGTHSGVAMDYDVSDTIQINAAWTTGWDSSWSNYLNASMFSGGLSWNCSDNTSLTYHATAGDFGDGTAKNGAMSNSGDLYSHAIVLTCDITDRTTFVVENTLGSNTVSGMQNNQWYSLSNYLFHQIDECWSAGARLDWFRDDDGQRVNVNGSGAGSFYAATVGLNWQPCPTVRIRPELRYDWFNGQGRPFDNRDGGMTGTATSQFTAGLDVILVF